MQGLWGRPQDGWDPTFYACSESGSEELLEEFAVLAQCGLKVSLLKGAGAGIGDASSLKLRISSSKEGEGRAHGAGGDR
jgi:hypothetical protein